MSEFDAVHQSFPSAHARYFIASCPQGHKPFVVPVESTGSGHPPTDCPACGLRGEFIPGPYYSVTYLETVTRTIDALHGAGLSARGAEAAAERMHALSRDASVAQLRSALSGLAGLEPLEILLPGAGERGSQDVRRFVSLMRALLLVYADHQGRASARPMAPVAPRIAVATLEKT